MTMVKSKPTSEKKYMEKWLPSTNKHVLVGGFNPFEKYYCSQNGNLPQVGLKTKNTWNHHQQTPGFADCTGLFFLRCQLWGLQKALHFRSCLRVPNWHQSSSCWWSHPSKISSNQKAPNLQVSRGKKYSTKDLRNISKNPLNLRDYI